MRHFIFTLHPEQGQARTRIDDLAFWINEIIFAEAQPPLIGIVEHEILVELAVMLVGVDLDLGSLQVLDDGGWLCHFDLDLHLERFLFHRAAQRDQFRKHRLFAFGQEGVDLCGEFACLSEQFLFVQRQQLMVAHQPYAIDHHVGHISGFGCKNQLCVGILRVASEARRVVQWRCIHEDQIGAFANFERAGDMSQMQCLCAEAGCHQ